MKFCFGKKQPRSHKAQSPQGQQQHDMGYTGDTEGFTGRASGTDMLKEGSMRPVGQGVPVETPTTVQPPQPLHHPLFEPTLPLPPARADRSSPNTPRPPYEEGARPVYIAPLVIVLPYPYYHVPLNNGYYPSTTLTQPYAYPYPWAGSADQILTVGAPAVVLPPNYADPYWGSRHNDVISRRGNASSVWLAYESGWRGGA